MQLLPLLHPRIDKFSIHNTFAIMISMDIALIAAGHSHPLTLCHTAMDKIFFLKKQKGEEKLEQDNF